MLKVVLTALISTASVAGAETDIVNFDQRLPAAKNSKVAAWTDNNSGLPAIPLPVTVSSMDNSLFRKLDGSGLAKLRRGLSDIPGLSADSIRAILNKNTTVFYNDHGVSLIAPSGESAYAILWESDKRLLEFITKLGAESTQELPATKAEPTVVDPTIPLDGYHGIGDPGTTDHGGSCDGVSSACDGGDIPQ